MTTFNFNLLSRDSGSIESIASPPRLRIPLTCHAPVVDAGTELRAGEKVGSALKKDGADIHTALPGKVISVQPESMLIEVTSGLAVEPRDMSGLADTEVLEALRDLGVCVRNLQNAKTIIINAVPSEPGISVFNALLKDYRKTIEFGLETAKRIIRPDRIYMAAVKGDRVNTFGGCTVTHIPPVYPNGLDPMVIRAITGQEVRLGEMAVDTVLLSILDLYRIGRAMDTGLPASDTIMTVGGRNLRVPVGTPVRFLLEETGYQPHEGDRVVLGGMLTGLSAAGIEQGIHRTCTALHVVRHDAYPPTRDNFCIGCGECARHCPARILPNMISRAAEFKLFERAEQYYINACIECGICGYHCKARRPLLQYIRFAKQEIALLKGACETGNGGKA